ncbi:DUF3710 domain-containing protein [Nocardioides sp.]|uniref:DUF3710 domain-containing protein n=1 Tax=Nocardioides sp. TaxID=35761 RepID=UPI003528674F
MRFRRKKDAVDETPVDEAGEQPVADAADDDPRAAGPYDVSEVDDDVERVDLGSLLITPEDEREVRLQVDEATDAVQSVLIAGPDGAVEFRAFAAPRHGDMWSQARPQIQADAAQRGGTATEREGRFGIELMLQQQVQMPDGSPGVQPSRVVGINGPRWFLRATFLGKPAVDPDDATAWDDTLAAVVVNRGGDAMPPGDPLPLTLPASARRQS